MSILIIATGLSRPSTLWMRRQLDMISDRVTYLLTDSESACIYKNSYNVIIERQCHNNFINRILHVINSIKLFFAVHNKNIDIIFIHYATMAVRYKRVLATTNKNIVVHCHGYDVTWGKRDITTGSPVHGKSYLTQIKSMPKNVKFIANSIRTMQRLTEIGINEDRITIKYLGINPPSKLRASNTKLEGQQVILYLGRLIDFKGPDLVIRAFEKACDYGLKGILIIAGDGPLRLTCELLKAHSKYSKRIKIIGEVDEKTGQKLREQADIFTAHNCKGPLSGQEEAFGVTMIEAMAAGLPIVNTLNGSIPEVIEDGISGILVNPGDIKAHAKALLKLQNNSKFRTVIINNAWERVHKCFTLEQEKKKLRNILNL